LKILITGGAGFIASHVVDAYIDQGYQVVIVDNLSTGCRENLNPKARFYELDIRSDQLKKIFEKEKPDIVNHHAAQISVPVSVKKPRFDTDVNVTGFINLMENSVKYSVKKIIFISSGGAIYGEAEEYPTSENYHPQPLSPYAINKLAGEKYLFYFKKQFGLDYTILRYANVYGPRQIPHGEAGVVSIFIMNLLARKRSYLYSYNSEPDGMIRDYVYVKDVVKVNLLSLEKGNGDIFNVGTQIETTTGKLYRKIAEIMNVNIEPVKADARPGDLHRSLLNIEKIRENLNWKPDYDLEAGLKQTYQFFKEKF